MYIITIAVYSFPLKVASRRWNFLTVELPNQKPLH